MGGQGGGGMPEKGWAHYRDVPTDESFEYGVKFDVEALFGAENMLMSVIRFDPGEAGPLNYHHAPIEEYYVVLEGTLDVQLDEELVTAERGTILYLPPGTAHAPRNPYEEPAVLLAVLSPNASIPEHSTDVDDIEVTGRHAVQAPDAADD